MWLTLKSKEAITSPIAPPPNTKTWSELAYTFPQVGDVFSEDKRLVHTTYLKKKINVVLNSFIFWGFMVPTAK